MRVWLVFFRFINLWWVLRLCFMLGVVCADSGVRVPKELRLH